MKKMLRGLEADSKLDSKPADNKPPKEVKGKTASN